MAETFVPVRTQTGLSWYGTLIRITFALIASVLVFAPRMAIAVLATFGIAGLVGQAVRRTSLHKWVSLDPIMLILMVFSGYLFINSSWALSPEVAYGKTFLFIAIIVVTHLAICSILQEGDDALVIAARALAVGTAVGCVFLAVELLTNSMITRWVFTEISILRPISTKHVLVKDDIVTRVGAHVLNRKVGAMMLLFWPAMLAFSLWKDVHIRKLWTVGLLVVGFMVVVISEHQTSALAFITSVFAFLLVRFLPRVGRWLIVGGWTTVVLFVIPLVMMAYKADLHHASWLPRTAKARIILWDYTSELALKAPVLGVGVRSTRILYDSIPKTEKQPSPGEAYPRRTGRHAHNMYLQTWYELGAVGALFLLAVGLAILRWINHLNSTAQPYAYAAFVAASVIAAFSWGMWQAWYMACLAISAAAMVLAWRAVFPPSSDGSNKI